MKKVNLSIHFTPDGQDVKVLFERFEKWFDQEVKLNPDEELIINHCFFVSNAVLNRDSDNIINEEINRFCEEKGCFAHCYNNPNIEIEESRKVMLEYMKDVEGRCVFVGDIKRGVEKELIMATDLGCNITIILDDGSVREFDSQKNEVVRKAVSISDLRRVIAERGMNEETFRSFARNLYGTDHQAREISEQLVQIMYHPDVDTFNKIFAEPENVCPEREINIVIKGEGYIPTYSTDGSSGADVRANESFSLRPGERKLIHTGIYMELPEGMEVQVRPRSGLAIKNGVTCLNAPGTIDSDYRGECNIILINHGHEEAYFQKGDRIAQFVFVDNVVRVKFNLVEDINHTQRGAGGFGHTGIK